MEDVVPTPITVIVVPHEPSVVVSEPPLVLPDSIFDFAEKTLGEHDGIAQSLGSMGSVKKLQSPLTIAFRLFLYAPYTPLRFWAMLCTFV